MCRVTKSIYGYDLLKFLMAVMIVSIHSNAFEYLSLSPYFNIIQLMGVPTFFLLSSFFFMKKLHVNGPQWSLLLSFIKRIGIMYMIWFVINLPVLYLQNRVHWTLWTFLKDLIFGGVFDGAWFLSALVVSVTLIFLLIKFRVPAFFIGLLCVVIYLCIYKGGLNWISLISTYETYCFKPITLSFPRALIWIFWGYVLSSPQVLSKMDRLSQMNKKHLLVCLLCISIFFMERFLDTMPYHLLLIVSVPLLCIYFYGLNLHESKGWKFLRDCSILFYLIHFIVLIFMRQIPYIQDLQGLSKWGVCLLIVSFISSFILYLEKTPCGKYLRYLH